ncbi:MAG TPA: DUF2325 domain-containing protein [Bacillota bacterium]|nr:DUF2325 domain-containing protein [Bacillota bacterium]
MKVLIIGADRLGDIPGLLKAQGVLEVIHWSGRSKGQNRWDIPQNLTEAIMFVDFIGHPLMLKLKKQLKQRHIPITYARRGQFCLNQLKLSSAS